MLLHPCSCKRYNSRVIRARLINLAITVIFRWFRVGLIYANDKINRSIVVSSRSCANGSFAIRSRASLNILKGKKSSSASRSDLSIFLWPTPSLQFPLLPNHNQFSLFLSLFFFLSLSEIPLKLKCRFGKQTFRIEIYSLCVVLERLA